MDNAKTLENIKEPDKPKSLRKTCSSILEEHLLSILICVSLIVGTIFGIILNFAKPRWTHRELLFMEWPINIGGSLPKLFLVPLIMSASLACTGASQWSLTRSVLLMIIPLFVTLLYLATCLGIIVALIIRPGVYSKPVVYRLASFAPDKVLFQDDVLDVFRNFFPPNVIQAVLQHYRTLATNVTRNNKTVEVDVPTARWMGGINLAGIIFFFTTAGIAVERLGASGRPVLSLCQSMVQICTAVSHWLVWLLPLYIVSDWACFFVAFRVAAIKGVWHAATLTLTVFLYAGVVVPGIFFLITRQSPFRFILNMLPAILNGFATASSLLTVPITLWCLDSNRVNPRISRLVTLLGLVLNLGGYAMLKSVSIIFSAQFRKKAITFDRVLRTSFATFTAHTFLGAPYGSLTIAPQMYTLRFFGMKILDVTFLIPMDWLGDHITTPASILSTALIAGIINHLFQKQLAQLPPYNQVLREGLLLKRLSQFATEEPEPEPFEAEDDVEPEQHIRRHSVLSEDITLVMSDGSGSGSDAGASSGTGRGSFGGGSARGSFGSKRGSGSGSDSGGGSGSGRLSLDSTLSSGPEGTSDEDVQSGASGASDTIGGSEDNGTADKGEKPSEKPKNAGKGLTRRGLKKKGKSKATKKTKKTSKGKK